MARVFDSALEQHLYHSGQLLFARPATFSAWVNNSVLATWHTFISVAIEAEFGDYAGVSMSNTSVASTLDRVGGTQFNPAGGLILQDAWMHVTSYSAGQNSRGIYLDGVLEDINGNTVPDWGVFTNAVIGAIIRNGSGFFMNGAIAEIGIWDMQLSDTDVIELSTNKKAPSLVQPANLVAYWPLIDNDNDATGNGFDMAAINGPTWGAHPPEIIYPTPDGIVTARGFANMDRNFINMRG